MEKKQNSFLWIDIFNVYIKTDNIYKDIPEDAKTRFDTVNYNSK